MSKFLSLKIWILKSEFCNFWVQRLNMHERLHLQHIICMELTTSITISTSRHLWKMQTFQSMHIYILSMYKINQSLVPPFIIVGNIFHTKVCRSFFVSKLLRNISNVNILLYCSLIAIKMKSIPKEPLHKWSLWTMERRGGLKTSKSQKYFAEVTTVRSA